MQQRNKRRFVLLILLERDLQVAYTQFGTLMATTYSGAFLIFLK